MKMNGVFLVVDDNQGVLTAVKMVAEKLFSTVLATSRPDDIPSLLRSEKPDVVLLDMNFRTSINSGNEGIFWLREIRRLSPATRVVLFTAYADIRLAVAGMKEGAIDFIVKPFDNSELAETLTAAFAYGGSQSKMPDESAMLWGTAPEMLRLNNVVEKISATDANVLITGENGTGKELLAREIHRLSARSSCPMVTVDMGAITESLFESELFGHVKGSFTDAKTDRMGKFEAASGGTLFLDEIGNLPYHLQAKLLTALQQRHVVRIGSNKPIPVDIRLICATNRNLRQMVADGLFREDLFYRINTIHLSLPALRDRAEDVPAFARLFIKKYGEIYKKTSLELLPDAAMALYSQQWAGNIRELEHVIEKAVIMTDHDALSARDFDLPERILSTENNSEPVTIEDMERVMISKAIKNCQGNLTLVAKQLGITRQTLYNKLKRYGM